MTSTIISFKKEIRIFALLVAALITVIALPVLAHAAPYAYVNQLGEVNAIDAATANIALTIAPNIDEHSGVILLSSLSDSIVGNDVPVQ